MTGGSFELEFGSPDLFHRQPVPGTRMPGANTERPRESYFWLQISQTRKTLPKGNSEVDLCMHTKIRKNRNFSKSRNVIPNSFLPRLGEKIKENSSKRALNMDWTKFRIFRHISCFMKLQIVVSPGFNVK